MDAKQLTTATKIRDRLEVEWAEHGADAAPSWDYVVGLMRDSVREQVHAAKAPCSQREFFAAYDAIDPWLGEVYRW